jgi:hypothetical protein
MYVGGIWRYEILNEKAMAAVGMAVGSGRGVRVVVRGSADCIYEPGSSVEVTPCRAVPCHHVDDFEKRGLALERAGSQILDTDHGHGAACVLTGIDE